MIEAVLLEQLEAVAALYQEPEPEAKPSSKQSPFNGNGQTNHRLDVERYLAARGVGFRPKKKPNKGRTVWVLDECPFNSSHQAPDSCVMQDADGKLNFKCQHNSCQGNGWQQFRDRIGKPDDNHYDPPIIRNGRSGAKDQSKTNADPHPWEPPIPLGARRALPPFPTGFFPCWQRDYVRALATATQTPVDLAAMLTMAVVAAALAKKFRVQVREGWSEPTNLFTVVALEPGDRKSAVFAEVRAPVHQYEKEQIELMTPVIASGASDRRTLECRMKHLEGRAAKTEDGEERFKLQADAKELARQLAKTVVPEEPQFSCDDVTPESLTKLLAAQAGRMLQAAAEGTAFEIAKGRYSETSNFDVYLKGHAGDPLRVNRVSRQSDRIEQPALSLALAVQPDVIRGLAQDATMRGRGFLARFLYSLPASFIGRRKIAANAVPGDVGGEYCRCMLDLWRLTPPCNDVPFFLKFNSEADDALQAFETWLEPRLGPDGDLHHLAGWANKLAGAIARIAGGLHMGETVGTCEDLREEVTEKTVEDAIAIGKGYLLPHAEAAFGIMGADPQLDDANRVVRWLADDSLNCLKTLKGVRLLSVSEIHSGVFGGSRSVDQVVTVTEVLVKHGFIRATEQEQRYGPGRKASPRFEVNPLIQKAGPLSDNSEFSGNREREPGEEG